MKATFVIQPELYQQLVEEAKREYGSMRKMSEALNRILARHFLKKKDLFGSTKEPFDVSDLREKKDRVL